MVFGGIERAPEECVDLLRRGPHVAQVHFAPVDDSEWFARKIDIDPSGNGERDHQRRTHEEVRLNALVNARLEISIPGENTGADDIVPGDGILNLSI